MLRIAKMFSFLFLASVVTVASVDAQTPVATDCGCAPAAGGCTTNLGDCGRPGSLFGRRQVMNACNDCGTAECGGTCGTAACAGSFADSGGLMDRLKDFVMPSDGCGGRYRSVFGGWNDLQDFDGNTVDMSFNDGFILGTARGRYLKENLRMEWESNWRNNSGENLVTAAAGTTPLGGQFNMFSTMINTVKEFGSGRIQPYIGAGIGLGIQDGDLVDINGNNYRLDDWRFAYQGIAGLNLVSSDRTDFYVEYRYYGNTEAQIEDNTGTEFDSFILNSENVVFGFRFKR